MKLFISYDTRDELLANSIVEVLRKWFPADIEITYSAEFSGGANWRSDLDNAIHSCLAVLVVCTRRSMESRWVHFEAGAFYGQEKSIIPVTFGGLEFDRSSAPLNLFVTLNLTVASDVTKLAKRIAELAQLKEPPNAASSVNAFQADAKTGLLISDEPQINTLFSSLRLEPNRWAKVVLNNTNFPYRITIDDLIVLYASPGWQGHRKQDLVCEIIDGPRTYDPEVTKVARESQQMRSDKDKNKRKLALVKCDPFMTDRDQLRLVFEPMLYFDFDGPRRMLFEKDLNGGLTNVPTAFGMRHYFGKEIPAQIPTPLACVHTILVTHDEKHLVLGLRRRDAQADFYDNRLCVGFEEQMSADDDDVNSTVKRGLKQETGIRNLCDDQIEVLAVGLEASFFSIALIAIVRLDCDAEKLHTSIQLDAEDHEWDALFIPNTSETLLKLLSSQSVKWADLNPTHFLQFKPFEDYEWHGTSRARLFSYLANKEGIGRLRKMAAR